jgi:hypothetical protein
MQMRCLKFFLANASKQLPYDSGSIRRLARCSVTLLNNARSAP